MLPAGDYQKDRVLKHLLANLASYGSSWLEIGSFHTNTSTHICWNRSRDLGSLDLSKSGNLKLARLVNVACSAQKCQKLVQTSPPGVSRPWDGSKLRFKSIANPPGRQNPNR